MLKITAIRSGWCLMALALGACSFLQQPAAPTEAGGNSANNTTAPSVSASTDNPYGSAPYTPPAGDTAPPYTPAAAGSTATGGFVPNYSPVDITAPTHTVERGDTVYNIAKRYQISQDNLRSWNSIVDNNIQVGQVLKVKPAGYVAPPVTATKPAQTTVVTAPATTTVTTNVVTQTPVGTTSTTTVTSQASGGKSRMVNGIEWQRPTSGSILQGYSAATKGIDFGGTVGQPIWAAADGKVVYAGSGLRGYGNLIIIQHNQTYLTAYGHNQNLLVKENQQVKRGQQIATMGSTDAKRTQLHFELRENGTPQDPNKFLP